MVRKIFIIIVVYSLLSFSFSVNVVSAKVSIKHFFEHIHIMHKKIEEKENDESS